MSETTHRLRLTSHPPTPDGAGPSLSQRERGIYAPAPAGVQPYFAENPSPDGAAGTPSGVANFWWLSLLKPIQYARPA
jgi:hypothetical protein